MSSLALAAPNTAVRSQAFVSWARATAVALRTVEQQADESDLAPVRKIVGSARVVALGEPGHGGHQPLAFRNRLFAYLVEHCGFTAIALETSFTESQRVDKYVLGGPGHAGSVVKHSLTWGFEDYEENVQLVRWMRNYNEHVGGRRKLHFYGMDMSGANDDAAYPHAAIAVLSVVDYLRKAAPESSKALLTRLAPQLSRLKSVGYQRLAADHDPAINALLSSLGAFLHRERPALIRASSRSDYAWAVRGIVIARQLEQLLGLPLGPDANPSGVDPDGYLQVDSRDASMAANVLWALRQEGPAGRLMVFAHDGHVMNDRTRGGIWAVFRHAPQMMGMHLRARLGRKLVILGQIAARNGPGLPAAKPLPGSLETVLTALRLPLFLLDLREARGGAAAWLRERHPIRANFDSDLDIVPAQAFDALIYIGRVTPALRNDSP